jgi:hypothetical protein
MLHNRGAALTHTTKEGETKEREEEGRRGRRRVREGRAKKKVNKETDRGLGGGGVEG